MAKWCGGATVVGLYFLLSFCLINCSTSELENASLLEGEQLHKDSYSDVRFRGRRQTTSLMTEYRSIQNTNISNVNAILEQVDHISSEENKTQDVKQEPPDALPAASAGNGAELSKDYLELSTPKAAIVSDPINSPEKTPKISTKFFTNDYHYYYNSTMVVNEALAKEYWTSFKNISANNLLSKSHRRAMTVHLSFDFPFYGHPVRNITVATGGFLYTGEYVHSWLASKQYIAPFMANFDTSLSNDSFVKFGDNGTALTVIWENVFFQDREDIGSFTFSTTLHKNGDIVFAYFSVPISIASIQDNKHPVKVGISDSYIMDKVFFVRRKTIYEYSRVNFDKQEIQNCTIIILKRIY